MRQLAPVPVRQGGRPVNKTGVTSRGQQLAQGHSRDDLDDGLVSVDRDGPCHERDWRTCHGVGPRAGAAAERPT